jgi:hypothetical protein
MASRCLPVKLEAQQSQFSDDFAIAETGKSAH